MSAPTGAQANPVYFLPWVGSDYENGGIFGLKVMILGESHYDVGESRQATMEVMEAVLGGHEKPKRRFWTNVEIALVGGKQVGGDRNRFWHSVLFYNYIQESLTGPRIPPRYALFQAAEGAFLEVVERKSPDFILVLGERLWKNLPLDRQGPELSPTRGTRFYSRKSLAMNIRHPSAAFSGSKWHKLVRQGLELARSGRSAG